MRPRAADFRCRFLNNGSFILNLNDSCRLVMTHLSQKESDTLIQVSYHTKTAYATQKRAPETLVIENRKIFQNS